MQGNAIGDGLPAHATELVSDVFILSVAIETTKRSFTDQVNQG